MQFGPLTRLASWALALFSFALLPLQAAAQSGIVSWGTQSANSGLHAESFIDICAPAAFTLALRANGTIAGWGDNQYRQCDVPTLPAGLMYTQMAGGLTHGIALRSDGMAIGWGNNSDTQISIPAFG